MIPLAPLAAAMLSAVSVALPKPGEELPLVERSYMTGAVPRATRSLKVQGKDVEIHKTGAWLAFIDVVPGRNKIEIVADGVATSVVVKVAMPSPGPAGMESAPAPKEYKKVPCAADEAKAHPFGRKPQDITIALDPGHGGASDTGTLSPHGFCEKDANLALAREVRRELLAMGYKVKMTRDGDNAVALADRPRIACGPDGADAFVSIHHNSCPYDRNPREVRHTCVYAWNDIGAALASCISARTAAALEGETPSKGVLHANFLVTRNPEVPSCLVEADFIVTPEGEYSVWNAAVRRKTAAAIAAGIDDWCRAL